MSPQSTPSPERTPKHQAPSRSQQYSGVHSRLLQIWAETLDLQVVGLDCNFFDLGGDSVLAAALLQRISTEFQQNVLLAEIFENPTIRQQAQILQQPQNGQAHLPSGVLALQPNGTRKRIFWVHYMSVNLAKVIGEDQPLLYVAITADDLPALGAKPKLQVIAACLVAKIVATQPHEPAAIGGYCLGGILGYEIAVQLHAAGHDVPLLVLVDPPNPSYIQSLDSLQRLASYLLYVLRRAGKLGLRTSLAYMTEHVTRGVNRILKPQSAKSETTLTQELIESAAIAYVPQKYDGKVLLVLASERPPHSNFLPGWQAVVPDLHTEVINAHHRDLFKANNALRVAEAIIAQLGSASQNRPALARLENNVVACTEENAQAQFG